MGNKNRELRAYFLIRIKNLLFAYTNECFIAGTEAYVGIKQFIRELAPHYDLTLIENAGAVPSADTNAPTPCNAAIDSGNTESPFFSDRRFNNTLHFDTQREIPSEPARVPFNTLHVHYHDRHVVDGVIPSEDAILRTLECKPAIADALRDLAHSDILLALIDVDLKLDKAIDGLSDADHGAILDACSAQERVRDVLRALIDATGGR